MRSAERSNKNIVRLRVSQPNRLPGSSLPAVALRIGETWTYVVASLLRMSSRTVTAESPVSGTLLYS